MHPQLENVSQTETGVRNVREGHYKGTKIEVVTAYDGTHDDWPFHVYVTLERGQKERVFPTPTQFRAKSMEAAFEQGMAMGMQWHDRKSDGGFQKVVRSGQKPF